VSYFDRVTEAAEWLRGHGCGGADVAVGLGCEYIKAGAPTRPERTAKYDRLMEIESQLS